MERNTKRIASYHIDRRRALQLSALGASLAALRLRSATAQPYEAASPEVDSDVPVSGEAVSKLAAFDAVMTATLPKWNMPGAQLAIAHEGRLVYNRGFGYASVEDDETVDPSHLFRIASTTKPITAVAILTLIDAGELTLDTPVFPLLALEGPANAPRDPRLDTITIEQLLVHAGGWNDTLESPANLDPQYLPWPLMASHILDAEVPAEAKTIVRYMLGPTRP